MMRFFINLHIVVNDKKITAIKDLRAATGMGLGEAKNFVETYIQGYADSFGGPLICNAQQAANLAVLHFRPSSGLGFDLPTQPQFTIMNMKKIDHDGLDISHNTVY